MFILQNVYIHNIHTWWTCTGIYQENTEKLLESVLFCLQISVENNERNKRKLLLNGLDILMDIEECITSINPELNEYKWVILGVKNENVCLISKNLIDIIGEFNYIVCSNCFVKQAIKVFMHLCMYVCMYLRIYVCMYGYMYVCICAYTSKYKHDYIHINLRYYFFYNKSFIKLLFLIQIKFLRFFSPIFSYYI
jgi:hypothetical protein